MPRFRYEAIDPDGVLRRGTMDAADEAALIERLRQAGKRPMRAEQSSGAVASTASRGGRLSRQEVAETVRELAVMLAAGQDLDAALRFLEEGAGRRARPVLRDVRAAVRDGSSLADALARHPRSFARGDLGIVRAGEASGRLAEALERLAELLERQLRLAATVQSALIYPALLMVAAVVSVALILGGVLPQFAELFAQSGAQLPDSTRLLIAAGDIVAAWWMPALLVLLLGFLLARTALRWPPLRRRADLLLLRLPAIGVLARELLAARVTRTLGTLLANGVPLVAALAILRDGTANLAARDAIERAGAIAREGGGLAAALGAEGILPARSIHLLSLGEEHGQLGAMALSAAAMHEERSQRAVQRLVSLLVPAITVVMGLLVALIVASLLQAMLSLNDLAL